MQTVKLRYGNTNTFLICGDGANLLIDTDYAGTLPAFYKEIKRCGIAVRDITYVMATHYHPDHVGLVGELMEQGVKLLLADVQIEYVHFADEIFSREKRLRYRPIDESQATVIRCEDSRAFLRAMGIQGEIIRMPSHSEDSVSVLLDDGTCIVGDLEPADYLAGYEDNPKLREDWDRILRCKPVRVLYAHANEKRMTW